MGKYEAPRQSSSGGKKHIGLWMIALAILLILVIWGIWFFTTPPAQNQTVGNNNNTNTEQTTQPDTNVQTPADPQPEDDPQTPVDTTDEVIFTSLDPSIATVTDGGLVTPVATSPRTGIQSSGIPVMGGIAAG